LEIASLLRFQILVDFALSELVKKAYNKIGGMFIFRRFCAYKKIGARIGRPPINSPIKD